MFVPQPFELVLIDPARLITGIVVDPTAPSSFFADVHELVSRYGSGIPIEKSSLNELRYLTQMLAREQRPYSLIELVNCVDSGRFGVEQVVTNCDHLHPLLNVPAGREAS